MSSKCSQLREAPGPAGEDQMDGEETLRLLFFLMALVVIQSPCKLWFLGKKFL